MLPQESLDTLYHRLTTEGLLKRDYKRPFEEEGIRIEHIIPSCFEGYVKIMYPWSLNMDAPNLFFKEKPDTELYQCSEDDLFNMWIGLENNKNDALSKTISINVENYEAEKKAYNNSKDSDKVKNWLPITWKEVCNIYKAHYHNELSANSFDYNYKGFRYGLCYYEYSPMPFDINTPLLSTLSKHTRSNVLTYFKREIIETPISQILLQENPSLNCLTTKKREWMTYIGHECPFIVVGGSYALIDDIIKNDALEVLECTPLTRIDGYSDNINR
jgi:hypothetical protein